MSTSSETGDSPRGGTEGVESKATRRGITADNIDGSPLQSNEGLAPGRLPHIPESQEKYCHC